MGEEALFTTAEKVQQERERERPTFESLPLSHAHALYSAWGLYGAEDELGTLNLLAPDRVLSARSEIVDGLAISLNLPLNILLKPMNPARKPCAHRFNIKPFSNDDELDINTQSSSHWDGLRHFPHLKSRTFYNGMTQDEISGEEPTTRLGVQNYSRKPIAGRGILLDYRSWAKENGINYDAFSTHRITLKDLLACAESQKTIFREGDILIIRSGWTEDYYSLNKEEREAIGGRTSRTFVGVENTLEMAKWHWDMQFAAVAGDTNAYEAWPPDVSSALGLALHEVFLAGWGMPIGEVWNLEDLANCCRRLKRWSFFLTSQPLDIPGGIASPCNAMAIF
ncbi:hypothetical protein V1520DRAFT_329343 [Lipomyces starkeyi]|uniref:Cyclase n=1 Tax=Lipomyces starkeyi NRRL Y-11557 TaxID=675824 RepID=A0A1E3Q2D7_LIPST|nr:hypothetical protein LIPSTDRAFT_5040 [Lipomyces starkeyi NRRL Y-11557]